MSDPQADAKSVPTSPATSKPTTPKSDPNPNSGIPQPADEPTK